ncbi:hypothetical protein ILUMI_04829 [Ignelater luminosus]|uniref:Uncharacterized protein n=1 Tax=Ignelater luminosus TaxID=2038154 RepID=A0A8K0DE30_IGNLU|nr:hypothetical protein ILUMI_04829 [Ignelater luminosus]
MAKLFIILAFIVHLSRLQANETEEGEYKTINKRGVCSTDITLTVNSKKEYVIHFKKSTSLYPYTVFASSNQSNEDYPVFVMVRQQRQATSWEIPLLVKSREGMLSFSNTSRTLCHNNINSIAQISGRKLHGNIGSSDSLQRNGFYKHLTISVSTVCNVPVNVTIRVEEQTNFYIEQEKNYSMIISPSQPKYFYYKYNKTEDSENAKPVILEVDSNDDTCLTMSIQNATCPVFDLNEDITYEGKYETIKKRGGVIIKKHEYPQGFFIVFVAKGDNYDCGEKMSLIPLQIERSRVIPVNHISRVTFLIREGITKTDYLKYTFITLGILFGLCLLFGITSLASLYLQIKRRNNNRNEENRQLINSSLTQDEDSVIYYEPIDDNDFQISHENIITTATVHGNLEPTDHQETLTESHNSLYQSCQTYDTNDQNVEKENLENSVTLKTKRLKLAKPTLHDLVIKKPRLIYKESTNYCLNVITVGIFYGIPVVQLVVIHTRLMDETGNLDICYYNFLCAHPYSVFNDYNHVLSNIGYIFFGLLFLLITVVKEYKMPYSENCGIPKHYGMYYAMGIALTMEGILSGCYHMCPNQSNFQFDTSFMYVMAVLCITKLYQNRHPGINANAYFTFLLLAIAVLIATVGILNGHLWIWIILIVLYTVLCIFLAAKIYFINESRCGLSMFLETKRSEGLLKALTPLRKTWFSYLTGAVVINIVMVLMGFFFHAHDIDFGTFLLFLLMGNAVIYTSFYIFMKFSIARYQKKHDKEATEKPTLESLCYLFLAIITWGVAFRFFLMNSSQWMVSPAESRQRNTHCVAMDFYDNHDIWHFSSASALFFSFMLLLTLDDNLIDTPRNEIIVF